MPPLKKIPAKKLKEKPKRAPIKKLQKAVSDESSEEEATSLVSARSSSPPPEDTQHQVEVEVHDAQGAEPSKQSSSSTQHQKKRRNLGTIMSEDDEANIAEWLRDTPCLFQKTLRAFKDASHKSLLWQEKVKEMGLESGTLLKTWYHSIRTRVGKLHKETTGSATKVRIDRAKFIWANFSFLADHITKMKGQTAFPVKPSVADPSVASSIGARSQDSSGSEIEEDQEPLSPSASADVSLLLRQRSADSSTGVPRSTSPMPASNGGLGKVKVAKRKGLQRSDDDTETILQQLAEQQRHNSRIQENIETMLSREQQSTTSAWGCLDGVNQIDPRLHRQMYRDTIHTMMDFVETSRLLPPLQAPFPADQQPPQQPMQQPQRPPPQQQPLPHDRQPTTSYVDMIPPPTTQPPRNNSGQQSDTGTWDSNPFLGSNWDTQMPMSGQRTASASFPSNRPPRPSSTPNISQSSIPNISGLSDMLNTPTMQD